MTMTIHTGCAGDRDTINVDWFDHDNVKHAAKVELVMLERDKPRTLQIRVDGVIVAEYVPTGCGDGLHRKIAGHTMEFAGFNFGEPVYKLVKS
jgi:hypothetical protein